MVFWY